MGIPEEDKVASWLRDWGRASGTATYDNQTGWFDTTALVANPGNMKALADSLEKEHIEDYCNHARAVISKLEYVHGVTTYTELDDANTHQSKLAYSATDLFREHDYAVTKFVAFVREMAEKYRTTDTESVIRVSDVSNELLAPTTTSTSGPPAANSSPNLGASPATTGDPTNGETSEEY